MPGASAPSGERRAADEVADEFKRMFSPSLAMRIDLRVQLQAHARVVGYDGGDGPEVPDGYERYGEHDEHGDIRARYSAAVKMGGGGEEVGIGEEGDEDGTPILAPVEHVGW